MSDFNQSLRKLVGPAKPRKIDCAKNHFGDLFNLVNDWKNEFLLKFAYALIGYTLFVGTTEPEYLTNVG